MVTVVDYDRVGASEPIGHIMLGCDQKSSELRHWSEMLATPRRPVAQWHTLKPIKGEAKQQYRLIPDRIIQNYIEPLYPMDEFCAAQKCRSTQLKALL